MTGFSGNNTFISWNQREETVEGAWASLLFNPLCKRVSERSKEYIRRICPSHFRWWQNYLEIILDCGAPLLSHICRGTATQGGSQRNVVYLPIAPLYISLNYSQPHFFFGNFLRRLAVALASTFLYGADQRESRGQVFRVLSFQVFRELSFRSSAYFLSGLPRIFFQVLRVFSFRLSAYFLSGLPNLSFQSSAYFLSGLPNLSLPLTFFSGLPRTFFQVFRILSFRSSAYFLSGLPPIFFQVFRVLSVMSSAYFLSGLLNLSLRSSAYFLSGLPSTFFKVFRVLSFRPSESFFQVFRALSFRSSSCFLSGLPNFTFRSVFRALSFRSSNVLSFRSFPPILFFTVLMCTYTIKTR